MTVGGAARGDYVNPDTVLDQILFKLTTTRTRVIRFVQLPELLERVISIDMEIIQLDEALGKDDLAYDPYRLNGRAEGSISGMSDGYGGVSVSSLSTGPPSEISRTPSPQRSLHSSKSMGNVGLGGVLQRTLLDDSGGLVRRRRKVLEARRSMLRREQGVAFARATAAGFLVESIPALVAFSECFGALRLREACGKFVALLRRREAPVADPDIVLTGLDDSVSLGTDMEMRLNKRRSGDEALFEDLRSIKSDSNIHQLQATGNGKSSKHAGPAKGWSTGQLESYEESEASSIYEVESMMKRFSSGTDLAALDEGPYTSGPSTADESIGESSEPIAMRHGSGSTSSQDSSGGDSDVQYGPGMTSRHTFVKPVSVVHRHNKKHQEVSTDTEELRAFVDGLKQPWGGPRDYSRRLSHSQSESPRSSNWPNLPRPHSVGSVDARAHSPRSDSGMSLQRSMSNQDPPRRAPGSPQADRRAYMDSTAYRVASSHLSQFSARAAVEAESGFPAASDSRHFSPESTRGNGSPRGGGEYQQGMYWAASGSKGGLPEGAQDGELEHGGAVPAMGLPLAPGAAAGGFYMGQMMHSPGGLYPGLQQHMLHAGQPGPMMPPSNVNPFGAYQMRSPDMVMPVSPGAGPNLGHSVYAWPYPNPSGSASPGSPSQGNRPQSPDLEGPRPGAIEVPLPEPGVIDEASALFEGTASPKPGVESSKRKLKSPSGRKLRVSTPGRRVVLITKYVNESSLKQDGTAMGAKDSEESQKEAESSRDAGAVEHEQSLAVEEFVHLESEHSRPRREERDSLREDDFRGGASDVMLFESLAASQCTREPDFDPAKEMAFLTVAERPNQEERTTLGEDDLRGSSAVVAAKGEVEEEILVKEMPVFKEELHAVSSSGASKSESLRQLGEEDSRGPECMLVGQAHGDGTSSLEPSAHWRASELPAGEEQRAFLGEQELRGPATPASSTVGSPFESESQHEFVAASNDSRDAVGSQLGWEDLRGPPDSCTVKDQVQAGGWDPSLDLAAGQGQAAPRSSGSENIEDVIGVEEMPSATVEAQGEVVADVEVVNVESIEVAERDTPSPRDKKRAPVSPGGRTGRPVGKLSSESIVTEAQARAQERLRAHRLEIAKQKSEASRKQEEAKAQKLARIASKMSNGSTSGIASGAPRKTAAPAVPSTSSLPRPSSPRPSSPSVRASPGTKPSGSSAPAGNTIPRSLSASSAAAQPVVSRLLAPTAASLRRSVSTSGAGGAQSPGALNAPTRKVAPGGTPSTSRRASDPMPASGSGGRPLSGSPRGSSSPATPRPTGTVHR
eukprot:jgi/Mesen1/6020/ME000306S05282